MSKIYEKDRLYEFLRPMQDWLFRHSYRRFEQVGLDRIPTDGAVIFAPNHCNALCDALAVLSLGMERKVFVARADIFRKPTLRKILTWLKIMPIRRMRDGANAVLHNNETEQMAVETLRNGVKFCILPEGTHRAKHSLMPLKKGIFRIALRANEEFGQQKPVYIVPVGLEYGDYFHLWDTLMINVGDPLNVTEFVKAHPDLDHPQLINSLIDELTERLKRTFLWVPNDDDYEAHWAALSANPPAPFDRMVKRRVPSWLRIAGLVLTAPLFAVCAALTIPLWAIMIYVRTHVKDPAFHNSVQYVLHFLLIPLSLFMAWLPWVGVQEWLYQLRQITNNK